MSGRQDCLRPSLGGCSKQQANSLRSSWLFLLGAFACKHTTRQIKKASTFVLASCLSGRQDSNLRPPGPKPGALPACATSRTILTRCVTPATAGLLPDSFFFTSRDSHCCDPPDFQSGCAIFLRYFPILSFLLQEIRIAATLPTFSRDAQSFCATSRTIFNCGGGGIRTRGTELPVRQFSKLLISATHPPHRLKPNVSGMAKLLKTKQSPKDLCN